ncbi:MAG: peptidase M48, partial [Deltaproteobacteria bacterium]
LAKAAAAIKPAPHILDTLAEGYWRRGFPCVALDLEQKVLSAKPKQLEIYQRQAEKFARDCQP